MRPALPDLDPEAAGGRGAPLSEDGAPATEDALTALAVEINSHLARADSSRIRAGQLLIEARRRVEAGEAGGITWTAWVAANVRRSAGDVRKCMALAKAPDPQAALDSERKKSKEGMARVRSNVRAVAPTDPTRAEEPPVNPKRKSRPARWADACARAIGPLEDLQQLKEEYQSWLDTMPEAMQSSETALKLEEIVSLDFEGALDTVTAASVADLPRGFGRD